jgi:hypothetical protein
LTSTTSPTLASVLVVTVTSLVPSRDSHFNGARLTVVGSMVQVKHGFSAAMGCLARWWWRFRGGADAKVAARGQAGGGRHEPARHHVGVGVNGRGYIVALT